MPDEPTVTIPDVEVLAVHKDLTPEDLDRMAEATTPVPLTVGETRIGWVSNCRRVGRKLLADLKVSSRLAALIQHGRYQRIGTQVFSHRQALRGVVLEGRELVAALPRSYAEDGGNEVRIYQYEPTRRVREETTVPTPMTYEQAQTEILTAMRQAKAEYPELDAQSHRDIALAARPQAARIYRQQTVGEKPQLDARSYVGLDLIQQARAYRHEMGWDDSEQALRRSYSVVMARDSALTRTYTKGGWSNPATAAEEERDTAKQEVLRRMYALKGSLPFLPGERESEWLLRAMKQVIKTDPQLGARAGYL